MQQRKRKVWSVKQELLIKSREAILCAVQVFNNPNIVFKSESFIVLANIAWTYLLHAYFRDQKIDYRYYDKIKVRKRFHKTKRGAYKYWELERCLNNKLSPIDNVTASNLKFLIGLRHEIEHQMTSRIDDYLSARFQACCLNYNDYIKRLFSNNYAIDKHLSFSLQFSSISEEQQNQLKSFSELPKNIASYIADFDKDVSDDSYNDPRYAYRVLYIPKTVNHKGQADKVIEFISPDSPEAEGLNREYRLIREREKPKHLPSHIVEKMKESGYPRFNMHHHTNLWKAKDGKNPGKGYGVLVANTWYWYDNWIDIVKEHCINNRQLYQ